MTDFKYVVITAHCPGLAPFSLGVVLLDTVHDELHGQFQTVLPDGIDPVDAQVIASLPEICQSLAIERGAAGVLSYLLETASNTIRVTDPMLVSAPSAQEGVKAICESLLCGESEPFSSV